MFLAEILTRFLLVNVYQPSPELVEGRGDRHRYAFDRLRLRYNCTRLLSPGVAPFVDGGDVGDVASVAAVTIADEYVFHARTNRL